MYRTKCSPLIPFLKSSIRSTKRISHPPRTTPASNHPFSDYRVYTVTHYLDAHHIPLSLQHSGHEAIANKWKLLFHSHILSIYISLFRLALNSFRFVSRMWVCVCFKHICTLINSMKPKAKADPNLVFPITSMCGRFCASREKIAPNVLWHYTTHLTPTISHNMVFQHNSFSTHI